MKASLSHQTPRSSQHSSTSSTFFKKGAQHTFFGGFSSQAEDVPATEIKSFFQPAIAQKEDGMMARKESQNAVDFQGIQAKRNGTKHIETDETDGDGSADQEKSKGRSESESTNILTGELSANQASSPTKQVSQCSECEQKEEQMDEAQGETPERLKAAALDPPPDEQGSQNTSKEKVDSAFIPTDKGPVGQEMEASTVKLSQEALAKTQQLADNQSKHTPADIKVGQAKSAVQVPQRENQALANAGQIKSLDKTPKPTPDPEAARRKLNQAVLANVPDNLDELNSFQVQGKAKAMGREVLTHTSKEVGKIKGTYKEIEKVPQAPVPPKAQALPPIEIAPKTPVLDLGKDLVPKLKEEHIDTSAFTKEADDLYSKEGIDENLKAEIKKVREGDLGEANKARKKLDNKTIDQPTRIRQFAKGTKEQVKSDMLKEEEKGKLNMQVKRKHDLGASFKQQLLTKSEMEKKRAAVTKYINGIYGKAKQSVDEKLKKLEKNSLAKFDQSQARLAKRFEQIQNEILINGKTSAIPDYVVNGPGSKISLRKLELSQQ